MLFTGNGSVRMVKNCDQGLENAALSLRRDVYQHTDIYQHTDLSTDNNNIYIYICIYCGQNYLKKCILLNVNCNNNFIQNTNPCGWQNPLWLPDDCFCF